MKRRPSEEGEFETGCHTHDANDMALIALTHSGPSRSVDRLLAEWEKAMQGMQRKTLTLESKVLEQRSLSWILEHATELYEAVAYVAAQSVSPEGRDACERKYENLTIEDTETIRDWFCWLHRELVGRARENQLQQTKS